MYTKNYALMRSFLPLLIVFALLLYSCEKEDAVRSTDSENITTNEELNRLKSFLSEATGTPLSEITFVQNGSLFTIDGDVVMSLKDVRAHYAKFQAETDDLPQGKTKQRRYQFLMRQDVAQSVAIYVDPSVPAAWGAAIDQAINNWNSVACQIRVSRFSFSASDPSPDITISMSSALPSGVIAQASFPNASGGSGPTIDINPLYNSLSASRKQFATTHELGHCFGFTHTNQTFGDRIPGTPQTDSKSVMNSFVLDWNGFTSYDLFAFNYVYPIKKRLHRYSGGVYNFNQYITTDSTKVFGYFTYDGSLGYIYPSYQSGTIPVVRYMNIKSHNYYYTTYPEELEGNPDWLSQGAVGYASTGWDNGLKAVYRYYRRGPSPGPFQNFVFYYLTADFDELGEGRDGWLLDGFAFWVWEHKLD